MPDFVLLSKTLTILLLAVISPGPDFVMVLRNALSYGRKAGLISALGIACGCLVSFSMVLLGIQIIFRYPAAKLLLSLACGSYLIYIGIKCLTAKSRQQHINASNQPSQPLRTYFTNGFMTNILNPKLYSLSTSILIFTEQQQPSMATNLCIILGQALLALLWFSLVSIMMSQARMQDAYLIHERKINICLGLLLMLLGLRVIA